MHKFPAARGIKHCAAFVDDVADAGGVHLNEVAVDQPVPASADTDTLHAAPHGSPYHGPHRGVHAGCVTAAGQNANTLYLTVHHLAPPCRNHFLVCAFLLLWSFLFKKSGTDLPIITDLLCHAPFLSVK